MSVAIEASEAILRVRKGEPCADFTGWQHLPMPKNGWLVRGNRGPSLIAADTAAEAIAIYEEGE